MLTLFKGQLSYQDITERIPFKALVALQDARIKQLKEEAEAASKAVEERNNKQIRNSILAK